MSPMIGEFEVDPETIHEEPLLEKGKEFIFLVGKSERVEVTEERKAKAAEGKEIYPYINVELKAVDVPGKTIFHIFSFSPKALANRSSAFSYKKFLEKTGLPYTTLASDLRDLRLVAAVKHEGKGDEARERIESFKGRAE